MSKQLRTIVKFLRSQLIGQVERPHAIKLAQLVSNQGHTLLHTHKVAEDEYGEDDIEMMASDMLQLASEDAEGHRGVSSYFLFATDSVGKSLGKSPNVRIGPEKDELVVGETEPSTPNGMLSQAYRHIETQARTNAMMYQSTLGVMERIITDQNRELTHHRNSHHQLVTEREQLMSENHSRELSAKEQEARIEHMRQIASVAIPLLPAIANRFIAGKSKDRLVPEQESPIMMALKAYLESLTLDDMQKVMMALGAKSFGLMEIIQQLKEYEEASGATRENGATNGGSN